MYEGGDGGHDLFGLATDSQFLYFVHWFEGTSLVSTTLSRVPHSGTSSPAVMVDAQGAGLGPPVMFGTTLYWIQGDAVKSLSTVDGSSSTPATGVSQSGGLLAVAGGSLVWGVEDRRAGFGSIARVSIEGGGPQIVYTGGLQQLVTDENDIYFVDDRSNVMKTGPNGGAPIVLASLAPRFGSTPSAMAADRHNVYLEVFDSEAIPSAPSNPRSTLIAIPVTGGDPTVLTSTPYSTGMASDGSNLYFTDLFEGTVKRVPITGGDVVTIAKDQPSPGQVVVDASCVYWTNKPYPWVSIVSARK